jgi:hypothetical protein
LLKPADLLCKGQWQSFVKQEASGRIYFSKGGDLLFEEDWVMRQIGNIAHFLSSVVLNKKTTEYEILQDSISSDTDMLYWQLLALINGAKINEAENLLFEKIDSGNKRYLELAIDFYARLNDLDDKTLENSGFTRKEIEEGLRDVADTFGVSII